jgi:hypothetical protein
VALNTITPLMTSVIMNRLFIPITPSPEYKQGLVLVEFSYKEKISCCPENLLQVQVPPIITFSGIAPRHDFIL